ncbi:MAG: isoleucine--tRNA ligase [Gemmatimonadota bacterium]
MTYRDLPEGEGALEEETLALWQREDTFARSLERRSRDPEFVFYEGPPTANGRPGVHHIISRTIKDAIARYRSMTGWHVTRIAGWDTHGLPVEIEAERRLGISGKPEIEKIGIEAFNRICRENLFTYKEEWERLSLRIGYWLDYANPYITCSNEYVESVWWALAEIDRRGLLYRGHKVVPYCPRCGTGLSSHEVALGYADRSDPSAHVRFPIVGEEERALLVWTTTPWTLVSNVAVAFGPRLDYVEVSDPRGSGSLILSRARAEALFGERLEVLRPVPAGELAEIRYRRPLDWTPAYAEREGGVAPADFVSDDEGTGLVHIAPAFGADDFGLGRDLGLPVVRPVDDAGRFEPDVREVGGEFVKDADGRILERLREAGLLLREETVTHSYPHCWRCDSPLLYVARDSWYVRTTAVREALLANNAAVSWHPAEIGRGRMGEWLENNVDWAISRDRYWGTPLPIWSCDRDDEHREVIGSYHELAGRARGLPEDFDPHRPGIDEVTWPCSEDGCGGAMRRVPEVMDAWFDSGSMPYAQWHYPFEHREEFERHFPAHFIAEGVDQTRGWFYSLLALSTILFETPAYRAVVVNDLILDEDGQKMSKSRGNVVDPWAEIADHGADAIRFYLLSSSQPWLPKRWDPQALRETRRKLFDTLRSTYRFFVMYARLEGWSHETAVISDPASRPALDRWLLSRLDSIVAAVRDDLEGYDLTRAARRLSDFVVDDVSNWYVRRSRDRFWGTRGEASAASRTADAFATLHEALLASAGLLAPFAPFMADWLGRELAGESVHLRDYPVSRGRADRDLEAEMEAVRRLVALGRAAREEAGVRVRQPLRSMQAILPGGVTLREDLRAILAEELNVREVVFPSRGNDIIRLSVKPEFGRLGPRFGARTPAVVRAIRGLDEKALADLRDGIAVRVEVDGEPVEVEPDAVTVVQESRAGLAVQAADGYLVALDADLDADLLREGLAREIVNRVQRLRREAGLEVSDRIALAVGGAVEVEEAAREHAPFIQGETLAREYTTGATGASEFEHSADVEIDGRRVVIGFRRLDP